MRKILASILVTAACLGAFSASASSTRTVSFNYTGSLAVANECDYRLHGSLDTDLNTGGTCVDVVAGETLVDVSGVDDSGRVLSYTVQFNDANVAQLSSASVCGAATLSIPAGTKSVWFYTHEAAIGMIHWLGDCGFDAGPATTGSITAVFS